MVVTFFNNNSSCVPVFNLKDGKIIFKWKYFAIFCKRVNLVTLSVIYRWTTCKLMKHLRFIYLISIIGIFTVIIFLITIMKIKYLMWKQNQCKLDFLNCWNFEEKFIQREDNIHRWYKQENQYRLLLHWSQNSFWAKYWTLLTLLFVFYLVLTCIWSGK